MESIDPDRRWHELTALRYELDNVVALPQLFNRSDGSPRQASPETVRFAEALAFTDAWSGMPSRDQVPRDDLAA
jgi:hypothetical protein